VGVGLGDEHDVELVFGEIGGEVVVAEPRQLTGMMV